LSFALSRHLTNHDEQDARFSSLLVPYGKKIPEKWGEIVV
jgi:hypothetical protein